MLAKLRQPHSSRAQRTSVLGKQVLTILESLIARGRSDHHSKAGRPSAFLREFGLVALRAMTRSPCQVPACRWHSRCSGFPSRPN